MCWGQAEGDVPIAGSRGFAQVGVGIAQEPYLRVPGTAGIWVRLTWVV